MDILHFDFTLLIQLISALVLMGIPIVVGIYVVGSIKELRKSHQEISAKLDHIITPLRGRAKGLNPRDSALVWK